MWPFIQRQLKSPSHNCLHYVSYSTAVGQSQKTKCTNQEVLLCDSGCQSLTRTLQTQWDSFQIWLMFFFVPAGGMFCIWPFIMALWCFGWRTLGKSLIKPWPIFTRLTNSARFVKFPLSCTAPLPYHWSVCEPWIISFNKRWSCSIAIMNTN